MQRDTYVIRAVRALAATVVAASAVVVSSAAEAPPAHRTFASAEAAVRALAAAVESGDLGEVVAIFAPDGEALVASSDPATGQRNREVFIAAFSEGWRVVSLSANRASLVVGNEAWPFPVPLVKEGSRWRFDAAAGKEEVLARRIGRNELAAIAICRTYVAAQLRYAQAGHDDRRAGLYATTFRSAPGQENGLYWTPVHGKPRSPLGDLVAQAAEEGRPLTEPSDPPMPFHGYYFKILTGQGAAVAGGARGYVVDGELSAGFAWPAQYDATGIMTFVVNHDGLIRQKDLGAATDAVARAMDVYNPDAAWHIVR